MNISLGRRTYMIALLCAGSFFIQNEKVAATTPEQLFHYILNEGEFTKGKILKSATDEMVLTNKIVKRVEKNNGEITYDYKLLFALCDHYEKYVNDKKTIQCVERFFKWLITEKNENLLAAKYIDRNDNSLLHYAAAKGCTNFIKNYLLMEKIVNKNFVDDSVKKHLQSMVKAFMKKKNTNQQTPLDLARKDCPSKFSYWMAKKYLGVVTKYEKYHPIISALEKVQ